VRRARDAGPLPSRAVELRREFRHEVEFYILPEMPVEVAEAVLPQLEAWAHLLPTWCHQVVLRWDPDNRADNFSVSTAQEYRWIKVTASPGFLAASPTERSDSVIHEFVHALLDPVMEILDRLAEDAPKGLQKYLKEERRRSLEATVCDITRSLSIAQGRETAK
jgi:hypothetical protein